MYVCAVAAAASSLQYCSVSSLMADVLFSAWGVAGGKCYLLSINLASTCPLVCVTAWTLINTTYVCLGGLLFAAAWHNWRRSCDTVPPGRPQRPVAIPATDCARVDSVRVNFPIKAPASQVSYESGLVFGLWECSCCAGTCVSSHKPRGGMCSLGPRCQPAGFDCPRESCAGRASIFIYLKIIVVLFQHWRSLC